MRQPCIKFVSYIISYLVLVGLLVISTLQFSDEEANKQKFSDCFPTFLNNFTNYANNERLTYRFEVSDFYLRMEKPTLLDMIISVWILGS